MTSMQGDVGYLYSEFMTYGIKYPVVTPGACSIDTIAYRISIENGIQLYW